MAPMPPRPGCCRSTSRRRSRPTNIPAPSNTSRRCRVPRPASCSASSCAAWRRPQARSSSRPEGAAVAHDPHTVLQPPGWPRPQGFANGILARGELVFVGGMIGQDSAGRFADGFVAQMRLALENIAAVLEEAGASPQHIVRLTWYVRDMEEYLGAIPALGAAYREV